MPYPYAITSHCLERFRIHYPDATRREVADAMNAARPVHKEVVLPIVGRRGMTTSSAYFLAEDFRGIFVYENGSLITYLRLHPSQQDLAHKLWGNAQPADLPHPGKAPNVEPTTTRMPVPRPEHFYHPHGVKDPDKLELPDTERLPHLMAMSASDLFDEMDFAKMEVEDAKRRMVIAIEDGDPDVIDLIGVQRRHWGLLLQQVNEEIAWRKKAGVWIKPESMLIPRLAHNRARFTSPPAADFSLNQLVRRAVIVDTTFDKDNWVEKVLLFDPASDREFIAYARHPTDKWHVAVVPREQADDNADWVAAVIGL